MAENNALEAFLRAIQERLDAIRNGGDFGPEDVSNFDAITLPGALAAGSLTLTTPLANNQLATPNGQFVIRFFSAGGQSTGVKKDAALLPMACTLVGVRAYIDTAPVGSSFIVDANKNGTTVFTTQGNRPTILAAANASSTTAPEVTAFSAGDRFSYDVDQVGSGTAGSDLYVTALFKAVLVA